MSRPECAGQDIINITVKKEEGIEAESTNPTLLQTNFNVQSTMQ